VAGMDRFEEVSGLDVGRGEDGREKKEEN